MKQLTLARILWVILSISIPLQADYVLPATEEDLDAFDKVVSDSQESKEKPERSGVTEKAKNFGVIVSEEAKRLKESGEKEHFGKWVSKQRRNEHAKERSQRDHEANLERNRSDISSNRPTSEQRAEERAKEGKPTGPRESLPESRRPDKESKGKGPKDK